MSDSKFIQNVIWIEIANRQRLHPLEFFEHMGPGVLLAVLEER
jgi:hypothetical protein